MIAMMKRKKSELGSWQLIKPTAPCKPYSNLNKSIEKKNKVPQNINKANIVLWKCDLDTNTNSRADAKHI